jgi:hypothetical protein
VFSVLHASIVKLNAGSKEEPETVASTTTVRRMVSVLVKRSLVSEEEFSMMIYDGVSVTSSWSWSRVVRSFMICK